MSGGDGLVQCRNCPRTILPVPGQDELFPGMTA